VDSVDSTSRLSIKNSLSPGDGCDRRALSPPSYPLTLKYGAGAGRKMYGYLEKGIQTPMAQGRSTKIISMNKWFRTSRLSIKHPLALQVRVEELSLAAVGVALLTRSVAASIQVCFSQTVSLCRNVDVRLPGKSNSNSHGARPVHRIITMIQWIRTSRLSIKNSLSLFTMRVCFSIGAHSVDHFHGRGPISAPRPQRRSMYPG